MKRIFKTASQRKRDAKLLSRTRVGEYKLTNGRPALVWKKPRRTE